MSDRKDGGPADRIAEIEARHDLSKLPVGKFVPLERYAADTRYLIDRVRELEAGLRLVGECGVCPACQAEANHFFTEQNNG